MFGILGGTGLSELASLQDIEAEYIETPFGSAYLEGGQLNNQRVAFLPRHGHPAKNPPHKLNYRANLQALQSIGVTHLIAITAVGSVDPDLEVGDLVVPNQIIDYTYGRAHTFFEDEISHIDFTYPYDELLRERLIQVASNLPDAKCITSGTYGCTNGPRLESAAEIQKLYRDGCTIVGMTAMPEAALARELGLPYAGLSVVVNKGAGLDGELDMEEISASLAASMSKVVLILSAVIA